MVFTKIEESILYGVQGETLIRKLTIRNTNKGALSSFVYTNSHESILSIKTNIGEELATTNLYELNVAFSAQEFKQIGDGDELFEFNEEIIVEEEIYITTCRISNPHSLSTISLSWGCDDQICDEFSQNTAIIITKKEFTLLEIEPIISEPTCFCDDKIQSQGLLINNISSETDIYEFFIDIEEISESGIIVENSLKYAIGTDTFAFPANKIIEFDLENKFFTLEIEELLAENNITILWDVYFVKQESCKNESNRWTYSGNYKKNCIGHEILESIPKRTVNQYPNLIINSISEALSETDQHRNVVLDFESDLLINDNGRFLIDLVFPCGILLDNPNWELSGIFPEIIDINLIDDETHISLEYPTPLVNKIDSLIVPILFDTMATCLDASIVSTKVFITSCLDPFCGELKLVCTNINKCNHNCFI